jgi:hypothetical protein
MSLSPVRLIPSESQVDFPSSSQQSQGIDTRMARETYLLATENPNEYHVEVGILHHDGSAIETHLGKDESYGAHRVGSVTKTFTTFLALKLVNDGMISLGTTCKELIGRDILQSVFADPDLAAEMTLEQLLSHTSGLEYDDHNRQEPEVNVSTIHDRFIHEGKEGTKYTHTQAQGFPAKNS